VVEATLWRRRRIQRAGLKKSFDCFLPTAYCFMADSLYVAVDLGAGSGRIFLAGLMPGELLLEEIRRFHYSPVRMDGHLRWNVASIFDEIKTGIRKAGRRARELGRPIESIGVDS